ncbi:CDP-alcohol phosphatidyltransferase family protein [Haliangium ochraceum]|nr:CDP-alcohol phosphatidyltransferase family protein [Haliangium ochraceum]
MTRQVAKRPLITANMVTVMRLIPMPLLCWLVYAEQIWLALVLGTFIGSTDFIDGYLARKHGPTVLGGLLDPIADKVFIALAYLPFADLGVVPAWAVALMFVREFLVTALRSAYEQRGMSMKTSYLGKVKTWVQMQGLGLLLLFVLLAEQSGVLFGLLLAASVLPLVAVLAMWLARRRLWPGALLMTVFTLPLLLLHANGDIQLTLLVGMLIVVGVTWVSGLDYLAMGVRELRGRGDFGRADVVRLVGAISLPVAVFTALVSTPMPVWAPALVLTAELSVGGLDNLLSHHKAAAGALSWSVRVLGTSALLLMPVVLGLGAGAATIAGIAAALLSLLGVCREFWRGRDFYLDSRLRDKAMRAPMVV